MLKNISKLLVLLATIQFASSSDNMDQYKRIDINIKSESVNVFKGNHNCNISNNSNNNNKINLRFSDMHDTIQQQSIPDALKRLYFSNMFRFDSNLSGSTSK